MKKFVLTAMLLALAATPVLAQIEDLGLYEDQAALDCEFLDNAAGVKTVYVVHTNSAGSTASQFMLDATQTTFSYLATNPGTFLTIGQANTGISVAYLECKTGTFVVLAVSYFASGNSATCSRLRLVDDPTAVPPVKQYVNCNPGIAVPFTGGQAVVNPDVTCPCDVATRTSTWGTIKALYR
jgi:hypothetical protein